MKFSFNSIITHSEDSSMRKWAAPDTRRGLAYFFALLGNFFSSSIGESLKRKAPIEGRCSNKAAPCVQWIISGAGIGSIPLCFPLHGFRHVVAEPKIREGGVPFPEEQAKRQRQQLGKSIEQIHGDHPVSLLLKRLSRRRPKEFPAHPRR